MPRPDTPGKSRQQTDTHFWPPMLTQADKAFRLPLTVQYQSIDDQRYPAPLFRSGRIESPTIGAIVPRCTKPAGGEHLTGGSALDWISSGTARTHRSRRSDIGRRAPAQRSLRVHFPSTSGIPAPTAHRPTPGGKRGFWLAPMHKRSNQLQLQTPPSYRNVTWRFPKWKKSLPLQRFNTGVDAHAINQ